MLLKLMTNYSKLRPSVILILILLAVFSCSWGQSYSIKNKKAIVSYQEGEQLMNSMQFDQAIKSFQKAIQIDTNFVEAYLLMAESYIELNKDTMTYVNLKKTLQINPNFRWMTYLEFASVAIDIGMYNDAKWAAEIFLSNNKMILKNQLKAKLIIDKCNFAIKALQSPVPFHPIRLSDNVNSEFDDYWPTLSADEQTLIFTRLIPINPLKPISVSNRQEDFYVSTKSDTVWQKAVSLGPPINSPANEGAQTISIDGRKMYFTACGWPGGVGRCDLYFSMMVNDKWLPPVNVGKPVNSGYQEKQPSLSPDGLTLYFASDRPGGYGGYDIWMSKMDSSGHWHEPVNLGKNVNTPYNEQSPFIHFDNQTLYFSSDGWPGMGNMDIYMTKKINDSSWAPAQNLGYPINTCKDEIGLIVNAKGDKAYFSSDRPGSKRKDIYEFSLYKNVQPIMVTYMKGIVYDSITHIPVAAHFELIDLNKSEIVNQSYASQNGEFLVCIPTNCDYALNVSAKKYLFYSDNFSLSGVHEKTKPFLVNIALQPIRAGTHIVLKNIFYEVGSYELKEMSYIELDKLVDFMKNNPTIKIEVSGHTDNTGTDQYNLELSENRAKSVITYLTDHGIILQRLTYKGYGSSKPVTGNKTEEQRAENRRTEVKIID